MIMNWIEWLDEFVNESLGAGVVAIIALLLLAALLLTVAKVHEVTIVDNGDGTETWHYKGETVIVDKSEDISGEVPR